MMKKNKPEINGKTFQAEGITDAKSLRHAAFCRTKGNPV